MQGVDQPRPADAPGGHVSHGPDPDILLDADAIDGPRGRPHAMPDLRPLEGRTGRRRGRQDPVARAEGHFAVRPDVHGQPDLVRLVEPGRHDHRQRVGPHIGADEGQEVDPGVGKPDPQVGGPHLERIARHRHVGAGDDGGGGDPEGQVMHQGVAHHGHEVHLAGIHAGAAVVEDLVEGAERRRLQIRQAAWRLQGVAGARDDIGPPGLLPVQSRGARDLATREEVDEVADHAGRPDVEGNAVGPLPAIAAFDAQQFHTRRAVVPCGRRHAKVRLPQDGRQRPQDRRAAPKRRLQHRSDPLDIRQVVVGRRLRQFQIDLPQGRLRGNHHLDVPPFFQDLLLDGDFHLAERSRLAGQPDPLAKLLFGQEFLFQGGRFRHRPVRPAETLGTLAPPPAERGKVQPRGGGQFEEGAVGLRPVPAAARNEAGVSNRHPISSHRTHLVAREQERLPRPSRGRRRVSRRRGRPYRSSRSASPPIAPAPSRRCIHR